MRYLNIKEDAHIAMQYDTLALSAISPIFSGFLPWSNSSLRPAAIQVALNEICLNERRVVIEFGSGISTVFLSAMLAQYGGRLLSIDHDLSWIKKVQSWLPEACLPTVEFLHAPLEKIDYQDNVIEWYSREAVQQALVRFPFTDLVIVDGPPAYQAEYCLNRVPAVAFVKTHLNSSAVIILDDIDRMGEQWIAEHWSSLLAVRHRNLQLEAGIAVWKIGSGCNTSQ